MKPWRPEEGWDAQLIVYHTPIAYKTGEYQADRDISMVEAGADAMLKAIRARGYISGESLRTAKDAIGWANINPDSKWYPIPDEE